MSIIYDALQKTQHNRAGTRDIYQEQMSKKSDMLDKGIFITIIVLSLIVAVAYFPRVLKHYSGQATHQTVAVVKPVPKAPVQVSLNLVLNGILIAGRDVDSVAIIDNQTYHIGDIVRGMKVMRIESNGVKLQRGNEYAILRTVG